MLKKSELLKQVSCLLFLFFVFVILGNGQNRKVTFKFRELTFTPRMKVADLERIVDLKKYGESKNAYYCFFDKPFDDSIYLSCSVKFTFKNDFLEKIEIYYYYDLLSVESKKQIIKEVPVLSYFVMNGKIRQHALLINHVTYETNLTKTNFKKIILKVKFNST